MVSTPVANRTRPPARRRSRRLATGIERALARTGPLLRRYGPLAFPVVLGLALRLAVIPPPMAVDVAPLVGDEGNYFGIAQTIAQGAGVPDRWVWLRPPGYPLFLATIMRLRGEDLHTPMVLQALLGALIVLAAAALAWSLWGRRAALVAAWWVAINPTLIYYTRILHTEVLYTALLTLCALALVRYARPGAPARPLAVAAVLAGLVALVRPAIVVALPLLAVWVVARHPRREWATGARHAALLLALVAAVIAPNALYNWRLYHRFIPTDTTLGYIFWLDHRDIDRDELIATLAAIRNPGDRQTYALRQGLAWAAAHPAAAVAASIANVRLFWGEPPYVLEAINRRPGVSEGWRETVDLLTLLAWALTVPVALFAFCRAPRRDPLLPLLLLAVAGPTVGVALSHHETRYMIPAVPLLSAVAAGALAPRDCLARSRRRDLLAIAAIALFLLNYGAIGSGLGRQRAAVAAHWLLAQAAERAGAVDAARGQYDATLAADARLAEPHERKGALAHARGDDDLALAEAMLALERDADNFRARLLAGAILRDRGQLDEARRLFARSPATAPEGLDWAWDHPASAAPPPARLALDGTDLGFARGFYGPEQGEGGRPFRWLRDDGALRLVAAPGSNPTMLLLTLASPRAPDAAPPVLTITVNGRAIGQVAVRRELGWNEVRLALPAGLDLARPLTVELRTTPVRGTNDRRALGVAVAAAALEPGPASAQVRGESWYPWPVR